MSNAHKIATQAENVAEIEKYVRRLLKAAGVGDQLPTPRNDIIDCAKLISVGKLDLDQYQESWPKEQWNVIRGLLQQTISKIKGFVHLKENIIYVDPLVHPSSVPFVTYHEVSHKIIPSHKIIANPHLDTDLTLDPEFAKGLEIEANIGASFILFQVDRFAKEIRDVQLGLTSAIHFAQRYGASLHSTFRNYVEVNNRSCALLILNNPDEMFDQSGFSLKYSLTSKKFNEQFGLIDWGPYFFEGHPIYDLIINRFEEKFIQGAGKLRDRLGFSQKVNIEIFHNYYNYFVLFYPIEKSKRSKKLVIVKSLSGIKS